MGRKCFVLLTLFSFLNLITTSLFAQANCQGGYPWADSSAATGSSPYDSFATMFTITLLGGNGSWPEYTITEQNASPGTDSCATQFSNPAYIPPTPSVAYSKWTVAGNTWGPDNVGWLAGSVQYIQQNPGVINIPCAAQINQALLITCPGESTPYEYNPNNPLDVYTYPSTFQNCRGPITTGQQVCGNQIPW